MESTAAVWYVCPDHSTLDVGSLPSCCVTDLEFVTEASPISNEGFSESRLSALVLWTGTASPEFLIPKSAARTPLPVSSDTADP